MPKLLGAIQLTKVKALMSRIQGTQSWLELFELETFVHKGEVGRRALRSCYLQVVT